MPLSPSMRREWIEISLDCTGIRVLQSPSMRREGIEMAVTCQKSVLYQSPSMRREWIEICFSCFFLLENNVSLHAEGVD